MKLILKREDTGKEVYLLDNGDWASEIIPKVRRLLFNNDQNVDLILKNVEVLVAVKKKEEENQDQLVESTPKQVKNSNSCILDFKKF